MNRAIVCVRVKLPNKAAAASGSAASECTATDYASSCAGSEFRESGGQHCERTEGGGAGAEKTAPERRSARQRTHISETRGLGGGRSDIHSTVPATTTLQPRVPIFEQGERVRARRRFGRTPRLQFIPVSCRRLQGVCRRPRPLLCAPSFWFLSRCSHALPVANSPTARAAPNPFYAISPPQQVSLQFFLVAF